MREERCSEAKESGLFWSLGGGNVQVKSTEEEKLLEVSRWVIYMLA